MVTSGNTGQYVLDRPRFAFIRGGKTGVALKDVFEGLVEVVVGRSVVEP
jgi:hypothetical protein